MYFENIAENPHVIFSLVLMIFGLTFLSTLLTQYIICDHYKIQYITEPAISISFGIAVSALVEWALSVIDLRGNAEKALEIITFSNNIFFFGFLPPIIFCSGYHLKRSYFFSNIGAISLLAVLGTLISAIFIALSLHFLSNSSLVDINLHFMECLAFGGLISTTDPVSTLSVFQKLKVDPALFYLVLGESLLNDAIGIAIFKTASSYIEKEASSYDFLIFGVDFLICCTGSCIIGYLAGIISARMFRSIDTHVDQIMVISLFLGTVYIPFFISETLQLSGIITILFTGITARKFTNKNISATARVNTSVVFRLLAFLSETSCFLFLGFSVTSQKLNYLVSPLVGYILLFCIIGRILNVYPLLMLVNAMQSGARGMYTCKTRIASANDLEASTKVKEDSSSNSSAPIPWNIMHMVSYVGMRGIVSFSCANIFSDANGNKEQIIAVTTSVALATLFIQGGFTTCIMKLLGIQTGLDTCRIKVPLPSPLMSPNKIQKIKNIRDFEYKYIYPLVIRKYENLSVDIDNSSGGGSFVIDHPFSANNSQLNSPEISKYPPLAISQLIIKKVDQSRLTENESYKNKDDTPLLDRL